MKHYSGAELAPEILATEEELVMAMTARLDGRRGEKGRLAAALGITRIELSDVMAGRTRMRPGIAVALGFRKVTRFERIS
jgi:predicted XRE-type DNA-binding protein